MPRHALRRFVRHGMLPQLMVFEAVARLQSVTRAGEELHLAQPTVSTQLKKLSNTLDLKLFEQRGRQLELTEAGRELYAVCEELMAVLHGADSRLARFRVPAPDTVRLAAAPGGRALAARLLAGFCAQHPGVQVSLHVGGRDELLHRMRSGDDDLYLLSAAGDEPGIAGWPVAREWLRLYAPADHARARTRGVALSALAEEPFVVREEGSGVRRLLDEHCARAGLRPRVRAALASDEAIVAAVAEGLGIALLPEAVAAAAVRERRIAALDVDGFPLSREWRIAHARDRRRPPAVELFLRDAREAYGEPGQRRAGATGGRTLGDRRPRMRL